MVYLTQAQKKEVVKLTNEAGLYLLDYYLSKTGIPQFEYTDEKAALALGWTKRKVEEYRRKLEAVDLFSQETYGSGEKKAVVTYVAQRFRKDYKGRDNVDPSLIENDGETNE